jgi:hypothetical protein
MYPPPGSACSSFVKGSASPDQLHGSACSLVCILLQECILHYYNYIITRTARHGVSNTPEHSNHIYLPTSSLIGDTDAVAWLRAARCTATGPHRASQAAIACTASLHRTPPFQAAKSKAFLVLSGRGAAVALVDLDRPLAHLRAPYALMLIFSER